MGEIVHVERIAEVERWAMNALPPIPFQDEGEYQVVLQDLWYGEMMLTSGMAADHVKNVRQAVVYQQMGRRFGIDRLRSLQGAFHIVKGRVGMSTQTMLAVAKATDPHLEWGFPGVQNAERACFEAKTQGMTCPLTIELTWEEVKDKQYILDRHGNITSVWMDNRADMLRWRCISKVLRVVCGDVFLGVYSDHEMREIEVNEPVALPDPPPISRNLEKRQPAKAAPVVVEVKQEPKQPSGMAPPPPLAAAGRSDPAVTCDECGKVVRDNDPANFRMNGKQLCVPCYKAEVKAEQRGVPDFIGDGPEGIITHCEPEPEPDTSEPEPDTSEPEEQPTYAGDGTPLDRFGNPKVACEVCGDWYTANGYPSHLDACRKKNGEEPPTSEPTIKERQGLDDRYDDEGNRPCAYCSQVFDWQGIDKHERYCSARPLPEAKAEMVGGPTAWVGMQELVAEIIGLDISYAELGYWLKMPDHLLKFLLNDRGNMAELSPKEHKELMPLLQKWRVDKGRPTAEAIDVCEQLGVSRSQIASHAWTVGEMRGMILEFMVRIYGQPGEVRKWLDKKVASRGEVDE